MVVMVDEWLRWSLECLQQPKGGKGKWFDGCCGACATKRCWSMAVGMLAAAKGWRLMAGKATGMLAAAEGMKKDEFSWLLRSLQQPREVDFA
ncbi:hypothetical protein Pyn_06323 [Prunus yedoensis var. nudiflora]|uniref:Uncharacterized protein n=1 Tax=Prunus yedoensis var. nudiflora TaxID=2094558 RepID=A0A314YQ67_PRUYE|nr:hypothetical protein Pyn_06323 [Prunus yedoensis var. nudiflora]